MALEEQEQEINDSQAEAEVEESEETPQIKDPADKNETIEVPVQTRQEKKRNRFREVEDRARAAEERAERAEREAREARERHQTQLYNPQSGNAPQPNQPSPVQQRLMQIAEEKRRLHSHYEAVASQPGYDRNGPQQREFERMAENLENARVAAIAEAQRPQFNEEDLIRKAQLRSYLNEHSDITNNAQYFKWAVARWQQLTAEGKPDTKELSDSVFDEARIKFGMQPRNRRGSRPDDAIKRRLSGVSSQSAGAPQATGNIQMTSMERKIAQAKYDNLPPKQAWQKWANNEGKRIMERRAQKSR